MRLRPEEPAFDAWRAAPVTELAHGLVGDDTQPRVGERAVIGVDGRSSSGKTTLAARLAAKVANACVVHTDDVAWFHSRFGWADLLVDGIIIPFRQGQQVNFRPPAWDERDRAGSIDLPATCEVLIVEGVGSTRHELAPHLDATVWVQADEDIMQRRNQARIATGETNPEGHAGWMSEEIPFLANDRPWQRATIIVAGTPEIDHEPDKEVVIAPPRDQDLTRRRES